MLILGSSEYNVIKEVRIIYLYSHKSEGFIRKKLRWRMLLNTYLNS